MQAASSPTPCTTFTSSCIVPYVTRQVGLPGGPPTRPSSPIHREPRRSTESYRSGPRSSSTPFSTASRKQRLYPLWRFLAMTGCRRGEALGLTWRDLDIEGGRVTIVRALVPINGRLVETEPKTKRGRRLIALDGETVAVLRQQAARQLAGRRAGRRLDRQRAGVHAGAIAQNCTPSASAPSLPAWCCRGAAAIPLHGLRHTYARSGLRQGRQPGDRLAQVGTRHRGLHLGYLLPRAAPGRCRGPAELIASYDAD